MCLFGSVAGNVFSRFHAKLFLEALAEIRRVVESHHVAHFVDTVLVSSSKEAAFFKRII